MGEPATPTPEERAATMALARGVIDAVTDDEAWPTPFEREFGALWASDGSAKTAVFRLAQDLTLVTDERDRWKARAEECMSELRRVRALLEGPR